ncbi:MAG TPA: metallophosphoesterase [Methylocella sp.]|nr:metallophosphoesterase [Methylocella sp.]
MKFLLAHLSDPHVGPLPRPRRRELIGKRVTGYLNWTRSRSRIHDMAVLEQIVTDMKAQHPSHVAMTGDISNLGLPAEFQLARNWLETLGAPEDVSFVPGNHDAYVRGSLPYLARAFAPWTTGDASAGEGFPYLRIRGEVALIGLSSGVPTPLFIAAGYLGRRQLQAAERLLVETGRRGLVRVVMLHHPPQTTGFAWRGWKAQTVSCRLSVCRRPRSFAGCRIIAPDTISSRSAAAEPIAKSRPGHGGCCRGRPLSAIWVRSCCDGGATGPQRRFPGRENRHAKAWFVAPEVIVLLDVSGAWCSPGC